MLSARKTTAALATTTIIAALFCCNLSLVQAQENIQYQIPPSLLECYNTSYFQNRDNRLPATVETLITLIEKIENTYGYNVDIRTLSVSLLHRFRQDGIQRSQNAINTPGVIPYGPTGPQFAKFRILLSRLIPGNANNFPNSTLSREERCSLHFMLSSSFDLHVRGDENRVCSQLSQYRAGRAPRSISRNPSDDVEILDDLDAGRKRARERGARRIQMPGTQSYDVDYNWGGNGPTDNSISQCPVENGVIWTPWGTVAAGTVLAGIAAGLQPQTVQLRTLLALSRRPGLTNLPQTAFVNIDNRWAATLAGDLSEVALIQVPKSTSAQNSQPNAYVGANGGWNSTVMHKWYFVSQRQNLEMTDAEIRGGLDGLILAMNIAQWRTQASSLKLSQLLRMYYSLDGVLGSGIMACNRKDTFGTVAPLNDMIAQTSAFAQVLDREVQQTITLSPEAIAQFSSLSANALQQYVPQYLNDLSCAVTGPSQGDNTTSIKPMTDIFVFLDTSWQYLNVVDYVFYILQRLNIYPYASSVTLLAAADGSIIVNTTNTITDVYENWNVTTHATFTPGFNLPTILTKAQNLSQALMNGQQRNNSVGGRSLVALLIPAMATVNEGDSNYAINTLQYLSEQVPDLKFLYYGGGSMNRFNSFVQSPSTDIFTLSTGSIVSASAGPVERRIKSIPRRIINPRCGANWYTSTWGTDQVVQYARPGTVNYYRMVPNYFFGQGNGRTVNIQTQGSYQLSICSSRSVVLPLANSTTNGGDVNCQQYTGNSFNYDISNACNGYTTIHQCPPLYISVQVPQASSNGGGGGYTQAVSCIDPACQTPDQLKYTIAVTNLGCFSGVAGLMASFASLALAYFLRELVQ